VALSARVVTIGDELGPDGARVVTIGDELGPDGSS